MNRRRLLTLGTLLTVLVLPLVGQTLTLGEGSANPGETIVLPLSFSNDGPVLAIAIQLDIAFDGLVFSHAGTVNGPDLGGHILRSASLQDGLHRVTIHGPANEAIPDGTLFSLSLAIANPTSNSTETLSMTALIASVDALAITPVGLIDGIVTIINNRAPSFAGVHILTGLNTPAAPATPTILDPDPGDTHDLSLLVPPEDGSMTISDQQFIFEPDIDFLGHDYFSFRATDNGGLFVDGLGTTIVVPLIFFDLLDLRQGAVLDLVAIINDPAAFPLKAEDFMLMTFQGVERRLDPLINDLTPRPQTLMIIETTSAHYGEVIFDADFLSYLPPDDFQGEDSFGYTVIDEAGSESMATVRISVLPEVGRSDPCLHARELSLKPGVASRSSHDSNISFETSPIRSFLESGTDVWYVLTSPLSGMLEITFRSEYLPKAILAIYEGNCENLRLIACEREQMVQGSFLLSVAGSEPLYVRIFSQDPAEGEFLLDIRSLR